MNLKVETRWWAKLWPVGPVTITFYSSIYVQYVKPTVTHWTFVLLKKQKKKQSHNVPLNQSNSHHLIFFFGASSALSWPQANQGHGGRVPRPPPTLPAAPWTTLTSSSWSSPTKTCWTTAWTTTSTRTTCCKNCRRWSRSMDEKPYLCCLQRRQVMSQESESLYFLKKNYNYFHFDIFRLISFSDVGGEEKKVAF